jgi:hypothetical protein
VEGISYRESVNSAKGDGRGNYTAGTGAGLIRNVVTAAEVVREIMSEAEAGLSRMSSVVS